MPRAALNNAGVPIATSTTITIEMPECFFTDDHGPIQKVQVIVSEPAGIKICHLTIQHYGGKKNPIHNTAIMANTFYKKPCL